MNLSELRALETKVLKVARENIDKHEREKRQHKNFLYEEAKVRFIEKQNVSNKYGNILNSIPWNGVGLVACLCIICTVLLNVILPLFSGPEPYVPGKRALDVSSGKQRNAADFVKNVILYGNTKINFERFIDEEFPAEKIGNMQNIFTQLREKRFDAMCSFVSADECGFMDFDIEYSSGDMSGMVALRLNKDQQFKIINLEKWR
jgi:hypothetical protein